MDTDVREKMAKIEKIKKESIFNNGSVKEFGLITKKCSRCGGAVQLTERGILTEKCIICGKPYTEPVYGPIRR